MNWKSEIRIENLGKNRKFKKNKWESTGKERGRGRGGGIEVDLWK